MTFKKRHETTQEPPHTQRTRLRQLAILGGVAVLVAAILLLKDRPADPPAGGQGGPQATATLPAAVGQTEATAELGQVHSVPPAADPGVQGASLPGELPEAQLDRLLAAGQPALAFFHSNNCIQCIKMMQVVDEVYPEFGGSVGGVDVIVYVETYRNLLQRALIRSIPTQIFFDQTGQGQVIGGAMPVAQFREQMQTLAAGE